MRERERGGESTIVAPKISARKATGHCSPVTESAIYWHSWLVEVRKSCGRRNEGRGITSSLVISSTTSFLPGNLHLASPAHLRAKRIRYIVVSCNKDQYIPELKFFRDRGTLSSLYAFMLNHISLRIVLLHLRFKRYKRSQLNRKQTTHSEKLERRRLESTLLKQKSLHIPPPRETNGQFEQCQCRCPDKLWRRLAHYAPATIVKGWFYRPPPLRRRIIPPPVLLPSPTHRPLPLNLAAEFGIGGRPVVIL